MSEILNINLVSGDDLLNSDKSFVDFLKFLLDQWNVLDVLSYGLELIEQYLA